MVQGGSVIRRLLESLALIVLLIVLLIAGLLVGADALADVVEHDE